MLVSDVMTPRPVTVRADSSVEKTLELLAEHRVSALPVVDEHGRVAGVVSEADLIRELVPRDSSSPAVPSRIGGHPALVADVMTHHAVTVSPYADVATAVGLITSTAVKSVPVVDERGFPVGMVSRADIVRVLARADDELRRQVGALLERLDLDNGEVEVHDGAAELVDVSQRPYKDVR